MCDANYDDGDNDSGPLFRTYAILTLTLSLTLGAKMQSVNNVILGVQALFPIPRIAHVWKSRPSE